MILSYPIHSKKQVNSLLQMAITLFNSNKSSKKKNQIYWVIEENETDTNTVTVKYYNEYDVLVFEEPMNLKCGVIDDEIYTKLKQTKKQLA